MRLPRYGAGMLAAVCAAGCGLPPGPAAPEPPSAADRVAAHRAYDEGLAAYDRGDSDVALEAFLVADDKVPSTEAVDAALLALPSAKDPDLSARFCDRLAGRALGDAAIERANQTCAPLGRALGRLRVECMSEEPCAPSVDGRTFRNGTDVTVIDKRQQLEVESAGARRAIEIDPKAGTRLRVEARTTRSGISPAWFGTTLAVAAGLGAGAAASAADVDSKHDDFAIRGCSEAGSAQCSALADEGEQAEVRTNVLFGLALGGAVTAAVLAAMTDFGSSELELRVGAGPADAGASFGARF